MNKCIVLLVTCLFIALKGASQVSAERIFEVVSDDHKLHDMGVRYPTLVKDLYRIFQYESVWLVSNGLPTRESLFSHLHSAGDLGLNESDYWNPQVQALESNQGLLKNEHDSLEAELLTTDAAIHYFVEVQNGNNPPVLKYNGLNYKPAMENVPIDIASSIREGRFASLTFKLEPKSIEYIGMKQQLLCFNKLMKQAGFKEVMINSNKLIKTNTPLIIKLYQLGLLQDVDTSIASDELEKRVKEAQHLFNLTADGKLANTTLQALNVSLAKRKKELTLALNYLRWLYQIKQTQAVILVNIPSASLLVYDSGQLVHESRLIVGKNTAPTPTLSSKVTEVILYPYWMVPDKIATKELLPQIKKNVGYLDQNNFQVLNKQGKVLDPYSINWQSISAGNFPFTLRQSTGCDNSLGIIKLNFYNPFTVYLHDTPFKYLFSFNKRYFSHGCMRVEKVLDLGRLVLKDNGIAVDTISEKGCLKSQAPITVPVKDPVNVIVLYSSVWYDAAGQIIFFDDVYRRNDSLAMLRRSL